MEKNVWRGSKFATRIQEIDKLQNRKSSRKMFMVDKTIKITKRRCLGMATQDGIVRGDMMGLDGPMQDDETNPFGFEPGPDFTLEAFEKYANDFKGQYFRKAGDVNPVCNQHFLENQWEPSVDDIEGEYWRIVEKPTEEIEVLYGADVDAGVFGSGFPRASSPMESCSDYEENYITSGWNLNNLARLPGSLLSFESSDISGVVVPWLYVGMCFSSFCWHVEDHHLYSINYMHWGAPKVWYGIPGNYSSTLEAAMKKKLPDLFEEQPNLLHKLVTQVSPSILISEGVPVHRCVQNPGEFVLTFPRAYHCGFSCGFNCAEAVNIAPLDWLPYGQNAVEIYREQKRKTTISHDKLLLGAAREAVTAQWELQLSKKSTGENLRWKEVCGKDKILANALKTRVEMEQMKREYLCSMACKVKMDGSFDTCNERECIICLYDLHLSAVSCSRCPDKFACLNHIKQLCSCDLSDRNFLFRYEIWELSVLIEAVEGKLSAIYKWAKKYLGMDLSSHVSKEKLKGQEANKKLYRTLSYSKFPEGNDCKHTRLVLSAPLENSLPWKSVMEEPNSNYAEAILNFSVREPHSCDVANGQSTSYQISSCGNGRLNYENKLIEDRIKEWNFHLNESIKENPSVRNDLDSDCPKKSPHIGKVVQRLNYNVEALNFGVVCSGILWSSSLAIFPKGFKSRVTYTSVLDPTKECYYISEILDAGPLGPLFKVKVEQCPTEIFMHMSVYKCWDLVREKVNQEIRKQQKSGRVELPPLQPPESINGFEMFGFCSPLIIQGIEAADRDKICTEYWNTRPIKVERCNSFSK
ncbi:hypothetical protein Scep_029671 [Stephania cephalantha]|uniref:JmjC domain-containing protein n=1 Tax=Stephania cephalantha TaxID=152367 RepID=A0AAP0DY47_9MAGN